MNDDRDEVKMRIIDIEMAYSVDNIEKYPW